MLNKIVKVTWVDAMASNGWQENDQTIREDAPVVCTSVGLLVAKTKHKLIVAGSSSVNSDGNIETNNRMVIPASWVTEVKEMVEHNG